MSTTLKAKVLYVIGTQSKIRGSLGYFYKHFVGRVSSHAAFVIIYNRVRKLLESSTTPYTSVCDLKLQVDINLR